VEVKTLFVIFRLTGPIENALVARSRQTFQEIALEPAAYAVRGRQPAARSAREYP
jgi:hypothetical protein